jgi:hypothetical protein
MTDVPERALLDLHRAAGLLGAYCAVERRLFELTGSIASEPDSAPEIQVYLDALSAEHAWHAELWAARLPVLSGVDAQALVVLPAPLEGVFGDLWSGTQTGRLVGLFRVVLPRLIASYTRHAESASPISEGPTLRALRLVLRDETEAWVTGEALVQGLLDTSEAVVAAGKLVISLEIRLTDAAVIPGLVPWPGRRA